MSKDSRISMFSFPTRIVFGAGSIGELGGEAKRLGIERPLLVTDGGIVRCGIADRIIEEGKRSGLSLTLYDGVSPNPVEQNVLQGLEIYRAGKCDGIIGLGGGSPLDAAKAIRFLCDASPAARTVR